MTFIACIIAGGQTGADRAALDWAIAHGIAHGGWCPRGRKAEDGVLDAKYQVAETDSTNYVVRTKQNVLDSDGTLVINLGAIDGGTLQTVRLAELHGKPVFVAQIDQDGTADLASRIIAWMEVSSIRVLNVAGPRESKRPGIYLATRALLDATRCDAVSK